MEFDEQTGKLVTLFLIVNLVAAIVGFVSVLLFGILAGLIIFSLTLILLPLGVQYLYLRNQSDSTRK